MLFSCIEILNSLNVVSKPTQYLINPTIASAEGRGSRYGCPLVLPRTRKSKHHMRAAVTTKDQGKVLRSQRTLP